MSDTADTYEERLYELYTASAQEFDKHLLFIATSALGISFAFIEKIVTLKEAFYKSILFGGWLCLTGTIIVFLLSHTISQKQTEHFIYQYKKFKNNDISEAELKKIRTNCNRIIQNFNTLSALLLILGILLILLFLWQNI